MDPSDGTCVRDYIHVMDLACGHVLALEALVPSPNVIYQNDVRYKAYNLGRGQGFSVRQIVDAMKVATGTDYKTSVVARR